MNSIKNLNMGAKCMALVSPEGGNFSIKLEDQVLITENGYENLTNYPFDENLLN